MAIEPEWHWLEEDEVIGPGDQLFCDLNLDQLTVEEVFQGVIFPTDGSCIREASVRVPRTWKIRRQRPPFRMGTLHGAAEVDRIERLARDSGMRGDRRPEGLIRPAIDQLIVPAVLTYPSRWRTFLAMLRRPWTIRLSIYLKRRNQ